jgi:acyl-CoA synthetase (AMP-forming)/AMP-acid ligase II
VTLVDVLRWRAAHEGNRVAFRFVQNDGDVELTYAEVDERARTIAGLLQERGPAGERALLVYPPGLEFVAALFGCMYAGWIAVPCAPPSRSERLNRLALIAEDAQPCVALTTAVARQRLEALRDVAVVSTDGLETHGNQVASVAAEDIALLQYTSGSTAMPRGVMVSHANLVDNTAQIAKRFGMSPASHGVTWLPPFHDMGLIGGILQCVAVGCPSTLLAPLSFLRRPARWLETISRVGGTISGGPNFAYELCLERISAVDTARLDLSTWEVAFVGAEPVRRATLERFTAVFARCGFRGEALYPCYGLAEATLMVTGGERFGGPRFVGAHVGCGTVLDGHALHIVDPETGEELPEGKAGEITVRGPSVARGYWRGDEFDGRLRTGDLGFTGEDGELHVTGRIKALLIVNGRKIHAEDIERTVVESHRHGWPGGVAAVAVDNGQHEELVVFQEVTRTDGVERAVRLAIAERHGLPVRDVVLLRPGRLPRTSSGKIRRNACPEALLQ